MKLGAKVCFALLLTFVTEAPSSTAKDSDAELNHEAPSASRSDRHQRHSRQAQHAAYLDIDGSRLDPCDDLLSCDNHHSAMNIDSSVAGASHFDRGRRDAHPFHFNHSTIAWPVKRTANIEGDITLGKYIGHLKATIPTSLARKEHLV